MVSFPPTAVGPAGRGRVAERWPAPRGRHRTAPAWRRRPVAWWSVPPDWPPGRSRGAPSRRGLRAPARARAPPPRPAPGCAPPSAQRPLDVARDRLERRQVRGQPGLVGKMRSGRLQAVQQAVERLPDVVVECPEDTRALALFGAEELRQERFHLPLAPREDAGIGDGEGSHKEAQDTEPADDAEPDIPPDLVHRGAERLGSLVHLEYIADLPVGISDRQVELEQLAE